MRRKAVAIGVGLVALLALIAVLVVWRTSSTPSQETAAAAPSASSNPGIIAVPTEPAAVNSVDPSTGQYIPPGIEQLGPGFDPSNPRPEIVEPSGSPTVPFMPQPPSPPPALPSPNSSPQLPPPDAPPGAMTACRVTISPGPPGPQKSVSVTVRTDAPVDQVWAEVVADGTIQRGTIYLLDSYGRQLIPGMDPYGASISIFRDSSFSLSALACSAP